MNCNTSTATKFKVSGWTWCDLRSGFTYVKTALFVDLSEVAIDITLDTFSLEIFDENDASVVTLTNGAGLEIVDTGSLNISVGAPVTDLDGRYYGTLIWTRDETGAVIPIIDFVFYVGSEGEGCTTTGNNCHKVLCADCDVQIVIPVGVQGGVGTITQEQFNDMMAVYNAALPSYASEEEAALDGLVSGDEFLWSDSTDVGIAGDKHIMS